MCTDDKIKEALPPVISIFNVIAPLGWTVQFQSRAHADFLKKGSLIISKQIGMQLTKMI